MLTKPVIIMCNLCGKEYDNLVFQCPVCGMGTCPDCYKTSHIAECKNALCSEYKSETVVANHVLSAANNTSSSLYPPQSFNSNFTFQGTGKPKLYEFQIKDGGFFNPKEGYVSVSSVSAISFYLSIPAGEWRELIAVKINGLSLLVTEIITGELVISNEHYSEICRLPFVNGNYILDYSVTLNYSSSRVNGSLISLQTSNIDINQKTKGKLVIYHDFVFK